MKKFLLLLVLIVLGFTFSCKKEEVKPVKVILPSGTPLMAVAGLKDNSKFEFTVVNGQEPLQAAFLEGEYDLIIAPFNLGAKLFLAGTSKYKIDSIITTNNTYIISYEEIKDINDLQGKKIMTYGTGSSPWLAYKALNDKYNLGLVDVPQASASDVATQFANKSTDADVFLSAEPNITTLKEKKKLEFYTIDVSSYLSEEVDYFLQACLFVKEDSSVDAKTLKLIEENIKSMNSKPSEYAEKVENSFDFFKTLGKDVITKAIPNCNIVYLKAKDNKAIIDKFCNLLNKYSTKVLNGQLMSDEFYK